MINDGTAPQAAETTETHKNESILCSRLESKLELEQEQVLSVALVPVVQRNMCTHAISLWLWRLTRHLQLAPKQEP